MHNRANNAEKSAQSERKITKNIRLDKNDKEVEEYLKSVSGKSTVKLSKFTQKDLDPLRTLMDFRAKLPELGYSQDLIRAAIDVLLKLLGHRSLEDLISAAKKAGGDPRSNSKQKSGQPMQASTKKQKGPFVEEDDYLEEVEDFRDSSPEPDMHDPDLYPKLPSKTAGNKKQPSKSPNKDKTNIYQGGNYPGSQPYEHPAGRNHFGRTGGDDDYDTYATSKKLTAQKQQAKKYTDKDMKDEEFRFKENLHVPGDGADEYEVYLSKMKIEKELTLFRMYLNIKRR